MKNNNLRRQAEEKLAKQKTPITPAKDTESLSLVHELEVHQMELEMQNEELVRARTETEAALRQYTDFFDFAPVGYFTLAHDGTILQANLAAASLLGIYRNELIKSRFGVLVAVESRSVYNSFLEKVFENRQKEICEVLLQKDGAVPFWVHIEASCIEDGAECRAVVLDITERKRAGDALREIEQRTRIFLNSISDMAFLKDENFHHIITNQESCKFYGKRESDILGKTDFDLMDEKTAANCRKTDEQTLRLNKLLITEEVVGDRCYETRKFPVEFAEGKKGVGAYIRDITERKLMEDQLRVGEARLHAIVDSTPFPMAVVDVEDDKIEYWSRSALDLFGHTAPTTTEWYQLAYPDPEYRRNVIERWKAFLEKARLCGMCGKPFNAGEYRVSCHDGSARICELYATFLSDKLIVTFNDITERKQAEEDLKKRENLLQKVFEVLPIGLWFADKDGKLLRGNPAGVKIWGAEPQVSPSEYGVFKARRLPSGEELAPGDWSLAHTIREGVTIVDELLEIEAFDGKKKVILNYTAPVLDEKGTIQGAIIANLDITDRKNAEEKLKENVDLLKIAGEKAKLGGWSVDLTNNLCTWSDETAAIHGRPAGYSPLLEEGISYYLPEWRDKITKVFTQCAQNGIPYDEEMEIITANGKRVWVRTIGEPVKDAAGKIIKVQGAFQDITERKQAVEMLRLKNYVFDVSIAANSIADINGIITEANDALIQIWGYSSNDEVIGNPISYFFNDPEEAVAIVTALNENDSWQGNYTAKKKDGSTFIAHSIATKIRDKNGKLTGYQSSVMDITEQKRTEEELREKETQYRALADSGLAIIWTAGTDKLCNYFNQPWLKFTGRTLEQEMGNGWTEGVHPEDLDRCVQIYVTAFDMREAFDMDYRLRHASGEYRWIRDLGTPNYNASGKFIGYIGHCFDITEHRKAEEKLSKQAEELRVQNEEMTRFNQVAVGREMQMIELKREINELYRKLGETPRYRIPEAPEEDKS